jgi:hypothetical protein
LLRCMTTHSFPSVRSGFSGQRTATFAVLPRFLD